MHYRNPYQRHDNMSIPIQVLSDIHLEQSAEGKCFLHLQALSPYLFLVGDIGHVSSTSWKMFIEYCTKTWKQVFIVLGNHEYYSLTEHEQTMEELENAYDHWFGDFPNLYRIRPGYSVTLVDHPDIHVLGGTGWSSPPDDAETEINDFRHIYSAPGESLRPELMRRLHDEEFLYILTEIEKHPNRQYIVTTHFPPIRTGVTHPWHERNDGTDPTTSYFRNDHVVRLPNIRAWLFGHTHYSTVLQHHGTLFLSNQFGRPSERHNTVFRKNALFYI